MALANTRRPLRAISVLVLIVLSASTVLFAVVVRSIVDDHERRLLRERTAEAGLVVTTLLGTPAITLPLLAATTFPSEGSTAAFTATAETLRGPGTIGALRMADDTVSVIAVAGGGPSPGSQVDGDRAALARRAVTAKGMTTAVLDGPSGRQLTFAVAVGDRLVMYQDLPVALFSTISSGPDDPFSEIEGVVYASTTDDESAIVMATTRDLPLSGRVERQRVPIGADRWLVATRSKEPLVGSFAHNAPWAVLGGGMLTALLTTILVETLSRRRAYALALVEERTAELEQARRAADDANRSKSEFLSRMSHELRTPLNAVLGFGQLLELDELTEQQKEAVEQIVKGGRHLLDLINEILDIARIETGALSLSPEPVHVHDVIADTLTLLRPLAEERDIRLSNGAPAEDVHVLADRQRLKQILLNLVANAVKYNRRSGSVIVSCTVEASAVRISVTDTGPGIHPDHLDRLFTPFDRLGAERSDVEGTGVGLALSRRLAEAMHGTIEVDSTFGKGSRFSVRLPVAVSPLEAYEAHDGAVDAEPLGGPQHKVLYVEDNLSNVRLVERVVEQRGDIEVIAAMQGGLGLTLAREHRPALILLDLHLPDMGGDEVLRELRDDPATATIPVAVISADATTRQIERLMSQGADAYLTKPLDVPALLDLFTATIGAPAR